MDLLQQGPLSATDLAIIHALKHDGRMPFVAIAQRVGVSERTVRRNFKRMVEARLIRVVAISNPLLLGFGYPVIIGVQCERNRLERVARTLADLPELRFIALTAGNHDLIIEGYFTSSADYYRFLLTRLGRVKGIVAVNTSTILSIEKQAFDWGALDPNREPSQAERVTNGAEPTPIPAPVDLDELDAALVRLLQRDARQTYVEMAAATGASEVTVARRVERLIQTGVVRIAVVANPFRLGFASPAIFGLRVDVPHLPALMQAVRRHPNLVYAAATTGSTDVITFGYFHNNEDLGRFLTRDLAALPGVRQVSTSMLLDLLKQTYDWGVPSHRSQGA